MNETGIADDHRDARDWPAPRLAAWACVVATLVTPMDALGDRAAAIDVPITTRPPSELAGPATPRARAAAEAATTPPPPPGDESGRIDARGPQDSTARLALRGVLFVPRIAINVVLAPVRTAIWAQNRYQLDERFYRTFFNRDRTIGLFPTATYETDFGLTAGARFVHRDVLGAHEHVGLQATTGAVSGTRYRDALRATFSSGDRLGEPLEIGVALNLDRRPADHFYGIGAGGTGLPTAYRYREARAALAQDLHLAADVHVRVLGAITELAFARSDRGPPIDEVQDPATLVGFDGVRHAYGELELRLDERRQATLWEQRGQHATGWLASGFVGRVHRLDGGTDYWRGGAELQHFWRIAMGPRVLVTRLHVEAVSGSRAVVPFAELPMLGGSAFLRGYPFGRFRDRVAAVGTLAYAWDLSHLVGASLFVDVGRVFPALDALDASHLRAGYGASIDVYRSSGLLVEASLASSIDGGLVGLLGFNSVFDARPRWR